MDGTLYQLDGIDGGFKGSSLQKRVNENAKKFIARIGKISIEKAQEIFDEASTNSIGISVFIAKKYQIERVDYFNDVWNIDPENIVKNFDVSVKTIENLVKTNAKLILVTSAPKVWQEKVTEFLELTRFFEATYTGEDFNNKEEIFKLLSENYAPSSMISIGDQKDTDILAAEKFGIKGFLIKSPMELSRLI